tara:strand:- start:748 stop:1122 length:375 start_codon:yes stop_codon:yes gene_type:complete
MRDILIKAKNLDGPKEWIVGVPQYNWNGKKGFQLEEIKNEIGNYNVETETICQFTGLEDSKENKIFENDIIEIVYEGEDPQKWVVYFNKIMGVYRIKMFSGHGERMIFPLNEKAVVVGNIKDLN